ncbi:glycine cleavage system protein H [Streptomyces sp. MK7]|uniref:glycine cleavage system protein H n=1 Tax=Streptomyces sp. MK7 TaxID=3067635 RepID=UPI0037DA75E5
MSPARQLPLRAHREIAMKIPRHLRYTWDHEWLVVDEGNATVGITAFAAEVLGDVVHLRLPDVGTWVEAGQICGEITSSAGSGALYAPATGPVLEVNAALARNPGVVNSAPYTGGWLFRLRVENIAGALTADAYAAHCAHAQGVRR